MKDSNFPSSWTGVYEYDPSEEFFAIPEPVAFTLELKFSSDSEFTGDVADAADSPMPEPGTVAGKLNGNFIEFVKHMPVATFIEENGSSSKSQDRHPPIYYRGEYAPEEKLLVGSWHILPKSAGLQEYAGVTGTWHADAR